MPNKKSTSTEGSWIALTNNEIKDNNNQVFRKQGNFIERNYWKGYK